ncbi:MAG: outer membrane beta-barrel protein [Flavobacteriales bacterium]
MSEAERNKTKFEFKPEYWREAEKLLQKEEKRRRGVFWWRTSGIAAMVLILAGTALYFSEEQDQAVMKNKMNPTPVQKTPERSRSEVGLASAAAKTVTNPNSFIEAEKLKKSTFLETTVKPEISSESFIRQNEELVVQERFVPAEKTYALRLLDLQNKELLDYSGITSTMLPEEHIRIKNHLSDLEAYASLMLHPDYGYGVAKDSWKLSGNVGFAVSAPLPGRWSFSIGGQYNHYTGLYTSERLTSKYTSDVDSIISYGFSSQDPGPAVSFLPSGQDTLSFISNFSGYDTIVLSVKSSPVLSRYQRMEKNVLSAAVVVPVELKYRYGRMQWVAGLSAEYQLFNKIEVYEKVDFNGYVAEENSSVKNNDFQGINRFGFNALIGGNYLLDESFSLGFRGSFGLSSIIDSAYFKSSSGSKNINFSLSLRYKLKGIF